MILIKKFYVIFEKEFERRNLSRIEGRRYCDPMVLSGQAEYLPENLRSKIGLPLPQMIGIYEDYARNIPGFQPLDREAVASFMPKTVIFYFSYYEYYFKIFILFLYLHLIREFN